MRGASQQAGDLVGHELAHHLGGRADDHRAVGKLLAFGDERARADQAMPADLCAVEHHRADADQRAVADGAAMQHHLVADRDVLAERDGKAHVGMQHAAVLHVRTAADFQQLGVTAQNCAEPHTRVDTQLDVADHLRAVGDPGTGCESRGEFIELVESHAHCLE